ncbi:hypothetical protein ACROYT_G024741 [Oculina patagonica]
MEVQKVGFKNIKDKDTTKHYVYAWNPCTKFSEGNGCKDVLMCQIDTDSTSTTFPCADTVSDFKVENDGTTTIMYKQLIDSTGYKRTVKINLKCDESKSTPKMDDVEEVMPKAQDSIYSTTLTSKCACDDGCRPNPEGSGGSSGLSTGSILLVVFFVLIIVYIIGGI